jgi:hypothetical protein
VQVCGLYPFGTGASTPMIGVPVGRHLYTGSAVCFDPISWYTRARLINNPSVWIEGEPGMGKSTAVRRMVLGLTAQGVTPLILGDLKPDYAELVRALGGQVLRVGPGLDRINPSTPARGARSSTASTSAPAPSCAPQSPTGG